MSILLKIAPNGRVCIPADVREKLGVRNGGAVFLEEIGDGFVLKAHLQRVREVQARYAELSKGRPPFTSDDLIQERRKEAEREEEQFRKLHGS